MLLSELYKGCWSKLKVLDDHASDQTSDHLDFRGRASRDKIKQELMLLEAWGGQTRAAGATPERNSLDVELSGFPDLWLSIEKHLEILDALLEKAVSCSQLLVDGVVVVDSHLRPGLKAETVDAVVMLQQQVLDTYTLVNFNCFFNRIVAQIRFLYRHNELLAHQFPGYSDLDTFQSSGDPQLEERERMAVRFITATGPDEKLALGGTILKRHGSCLP